MATAFSDISLYLPTPYTVGTPEYYDQAALENFVSDLYVRHMNGYKPPRTSRITIQPDFHDSWKKPWKHGSIANVAPYFVSEHYGLSDKKEKSKQILSLIQNGTMVLCEEYGWDKSVFENAYKQIIDADFKFLLEYPKKPSRDKKKTAGLIIEKTETVTSVYVRIEENKSVRVKKLFEKKNAWCYDCIYALARATKWFDPNRFGISYDKGGIEIRYSLENDNVEFCENGRKVDKIDFSKYFMFN